MAAWYLSIVESNSSRKKEPNAAVPRDPVQDRHFRGKRLHPFLSVYKNDSALIPFLVVINVLSFDHGRMWSLTH